MWSAFSRWVRAEPPPGSKPHPAYVGAMYALGAVPFFIAGQRVPGLGWTALALSTIAIGLYRGRRQPR